MQLKSFTVKKLQDQARALKHIYELKDWAWSKFKRHHELFEELKRKMIELNLNIMCPCDKPFDEGETPIMCDCGTLNHLECITWNFTENEILNRARSCQQYNPEYHRIKNHEFSQHV